MFIIKTLYMALTKILTQHLPNYYKIVTFY